MKIFRTSQSDGTEILLVPAFIKADIYRNVPHDIPFLKLHILFVGHGGKLSVVLGQFKRDPVVSGLVCLFYSVVQSFAFCVAALQIRKLAFISSCFSFAENRRVNKFHNELHFSKILYVNAMIT